MHRLVLDWKYFIEANGAPFGVMLALGGLCMLWMGWRFERFAIVTIYMAAGVIARDALELDWLGAFVGGIVFAGVAGFAGTLLRKWAAPVLCGTMSALTAWAVTGDTTLPEPTVYIVLLLAFIVIAAISWADIQTATIVLTSFAGASLLASGIIAMVGTSQVFGPHLRSMSTYWIFYPFLLIAPTFMGIFLQLGAVKRKDGGEAAF